MPTIIFYPLIKGAPNGRKATRVCRDEFQGTEILEEEWCFLLEVRNARDDQNFFELGGDSLAAIELITRVAERGGGEVPVEAIFLDGSYAAVRNALVSAASHAQPHPQRGK